MRTLLPAVNADRVVRALKLSGWSVLALLLVALLLVVLLPLIDLGVYRATFESRLSSALGRPVTITGRMTLGLALHPSVTLADVSVANPSWASRPALARIERVRVQFALSALLDRRLEITSLELEGLDALLERRAGGAANWTLGPSGPAPGPVSGVAVEALSCERCVLAYRGKDEYRVALSALSAAIAPAEPLQVLASGAYRDVSWTLSLVGGNLQDLLAAPAPWPIELKLRAAGATLSAKGELRGSDVDAEFTLSGEDLGQLTSALPAPASVSGPYKLSGRVSTQDARFRLTSLSGSFTEDGRPVVLESGTMVAGAASPVELALAGKIGGQPFDVSLKGGPAQALPAEPWPVELSIRLAEASADVRGTIARPLAAEGIDLRVRAKGVGLASLGRLAGASLPELGAWALTGRLQDGEQGYAVSDLKARLADTEIQGTLALRRPEGRPDVHADLRLSGIDLRKLLPAGRAPTDETGGGWPIPFPALRTIDAELVLAVGRVVGAPTELRDLRGHARLEQGRLEIDELRFHTPLARVRGRASLDARADTPALAASATLTALDVGKALNAFVLATDRVSGKLQRVELELNTSGRTLAELRGHGALRIEARSGELSYWRGTERNVVRANLKRLEGRAQADAALTLAAEGALREVPFEVRLEGEALRHLLRAPDAYPVKVSARLAGDAAKLEGTLGWAADKPRLAVDLRLSGPSLETINRLFDVQIPELGPYEIAGRLTGEGGRYQLSGFDLKLDKSELTGSATLATSTPRPRLDVEIAARVVDLSELARDLHWGGAEQQTEVKTDRMLRRLLGMQPLSRTLDLRLAVSADRLLAGNVDIGDLQLDVESGNGRLRVSPFNLTVHDGKISGALEIDAGSDTATSRLELTVRQIDYGTLLKELGIRDGVQGTLDAELRLEGRGQTQESVLAGLKGSIVLVSGPTLITGGDLGLWGAGVLSGLTSITTTALGIERDTRFNCMVWPFEVADGIARSETILMDTPKMTIHGGGTINLATEELDLLLRPARKRASLFSLDNPVRVTGTLAQPQRTTLGKTETFAKLMLAFLNPAFLLLSVDIGTGATNPCVAAIAASERDPDAKQAVGLREDVRGFLRQLRSPLTPSPDRGQPSGDKAPVQELSEPR